MTVSVGSIALCRSAAEFGFASPDYVVFRLKPDAPFTGEYLLHYLQSSIGLRQIAREAQGTIRSRLYFDTWHAFWFPYPLGLKLGMSSCRGSSGSNNCSASCPTSETGRCRR